MNNVAVAVAVRGKGIDRLGSSGLRQLCTRLTRLLQPAPVLGITHDLRHLFRREIVLRERMGAWIMSQGARHPLTALTELTELTAADSAEQSRFAHSPLSCRPF